MNRKQNASLNRHVKYRQVLTDGAAEVATVPAFADLVATYDQHLALVLPALGIQQGTSSQGATEVKTSHGDALVPALVRHASALMLLLKKEGNLEAARSLLINRSDYSRLGGPALAAEAAHVAQVARQRLAALSPYGLTEASVAALEATTAAYTAALPGPKVSIERRKVGTLTLRNALKAADDFLNEELLAGAELLANDHALLYARLKEARRIDDAGYGRGAQAQAKKKARKAAKNKAAKNKDQKQGPAASNPAPGDADSEGR